MCPQTLASGFGQSFDAWSLTTPNSEPPQVVSLNISIKVVSPVRNRKKTRAREDGDLG